MAITRTTIPFRAGLVPYARAMRELIEVRFEVHWINITRQQVTLTTIER